MSDLPDLSDYYIIIFVGGIIISLIFFYRYFLLSTETTKNTNNEIVKVYTLETMANPIDSFCDHYETIPSELKSEAEKLTKENCVNSKCTVWLNDEKCVAGNASGPTYKTDNGVKVDVDNYYYMNKCYGNNCPA